MPLMYEDIKIYPTIVSKPVINIKFCTQSFASGKVYILNNINYNSYKNYFTKTYVLLWLLFDIKYNNSLVVLNILSNVKYEALNICKLVCSIGVSKHCDSWQKRDKLQFFRILFSNTH
jgi:hypothetical protein